MVFSVCGTLRRLIRVASAEVPQAPRRGKPVRVRARRRPLLVEPLEDRRLLSLPGAVGLAGPVAETPADAGHFCAAGQPAPELPGCPNLAAGLLPAPSGRAITAEDLPADWVMIPTYQEVPEYSWHYGCAPTAGGMLIGWWDAQPGTTNLFEGDASGWWGDASESLSGGTKAMVAATPHIVAGRENGHTYGDWRNSPSYPDHESNPGSLADFTKTTDGWTLASDLASGLERFVAWDVPWTATDEGYHGEATTDYTFLGWEFDDFCREIDRGYPVLLGATDHFVLAMGYFDHRSPADPGDYGYICYTTWPGWGLTAWRWQGQEVPEKGATYSVYGGISLRVTPRVPATCTWDGGGHDDFWGTAANWAADAVPSSGDHLVFEGPNRNQAVNDLGPGTEFASICFSDPGFTLTGHRVTLDAQGGTAIRNDADGGQTVALPVRLGSPGTIETAAGHIRIAGDIDTQGHELAFDIRSPGGENNCSGAIRGSGGVRKMGPGRLSLSGSNTYYGPTTVGAGCLAVDGSLAPESYVLVGEQAALSGTGTIGGPVTVERGGTLAPGAATGVLASGSVELQPGSILAIELGAPAPGEGHDQLRVAGTVDLEGATLDVSLGSAPASGQTLVIIDNDGSDAVVGQFANLPDDSTFLVDGHPLQIDYHGGDGNDVALISPAAKVLRRYVFYNNSAFDDPVGGLGDDAVAPDPDRCPDPRQGKTALLPGQSATFQNYTSYSRGINGIMIDIRNPTGTPTPRTFEFRVGNDDDPAGWQPIAPHSVTVRPGRGMEGSTRVTIVWEDHVIRGCWLQVTVNAAEVGLPGDDVFYFGNAPGESGDQPGHAIVNTADELLARDHQRGPRNPAPLCDPHDYNRDGLVNVTDRIIARSSRTAPGTALRLITAPPMPAESQPAPGPGPGQSAVASSARAEVATAQCSTELKSAALHDAVLERAWRRRTERRQGPSAKLAWLWDSAAPDPGPIFRELHVAEQPAVGRVRGSPVEFRAAGTA